jgi:DNA polymerase III epsilon subunit-like protein
MFLRSCGREKYRLVWFDLETTGFNPFKNEIIEIAAVDNLGNTFEQLVKPIKPIPKKITEITKITNEMVQDKADAKTAIELFVEFIRGKNTNTHPIYLIGHNSHSFDMPFVKAKCNEYNIKLPNVYQLDTMRMSQFILTDQWSHSLASLCSLFGIDNKNAHRAMSDVYATQIIYCNLCLLFKREFQKSDPNTLYYKTSVLFT